MRRLWLSRGIEMSTKEPVVAVALLTELELERLGKTFTRFCPVTETASFDDLLIAIDVADRGQCEANRKDA
ncbi:hypothetical protein [Sphingomonas sp.]|uniref:hypothetical protein n=1 Tax=Sphingomonas sp. TaxID=28214 RepID=UPI002FDB788F